MSSHPSLVEGVVCLATLAWLVDILPGGSSVDRHSCCSRHDHLRPRSRKTGNPARVSKPTTSLLAPRQSRDRVRCLMASILLWNLQSFTSMITAVCCIWLKHWYQYFVHSQSLPSAISAGLAKTRTIRTRHKSGASQAWNASCLSLGWRHLGKLLWQHPVLLMALGLAVQVTSGQAGAVNESLTRGLCQDRLTHEVSVQSSIIFNTTLSRLGRAQRSADTCGGERDYLEQLQSELLRMKAQLSSDSGFGGGVGPNYGCFQMIESINATAEELKVLAYDVVTKLFAADSRNDEIKTAYEAQIEMFSKKVLAIIRKIEGKFGESADDIRESYKFTFSNQIDLLEGFQKGLVDGIHPMNSTNRAVLTARHGSDLIGYEYVPANASWLYRWRETVFEPRASMAGYPWWVTDSLADGSTVLMLRHQAGIRFYQPQSHPQALRLLAQDGRFPDVFGWMNDDHVLVAGRFYPDRQLVGVMARNQHGAVKFYAVIRSRVLANQSEPLWPFNKKLSLSAAWTSSQTKFFVTDIQRSGQDAIVLRTAAGLEVYRFRDDYSLQNVLNISQMALPPPGIVVDERLLFCELTNQPYKDIILLNDSGLFTYRYNSSQQDYTLLNYLPELSRHNGWQPEFSKTIQLIDINGDGRDELLFTGVHGLTGLTFHLATSSWRVAADPAYLIGWQRYASLVSATGPMPPLITTPLAFAQDAQQGLRWAQVTKHARARSDDDSKTELATGITDDLGVVSCLRQRHSGPTPAQIARASIPETPTLRWAEQWEDRFLEEAVEAASGTVRCSVPLLDVQDPQGLGLQLALSYHSQSSASDLVGHGWTLALAVDFIGVDHRGSIYPQDARYYLSTQDGVWELQPTSAQGNEQHFHVPAQPEVDFLFEPDKQRWTVESATEQAIYGRANDSAATDGLQWSLQWPSWRGVGSDKAFLLPLVTAWYLNARRAKQRRRQLVYRYEVDSARIQGGQSYTVALRLKTVSDGQQMTLAFDYGVKTEAEYAAPTPVDGKGNIFFPIPLAKKQFLRGYSITTAAYKQTLQFAYRVEGRTRLLTAINQLVGSHTESVLRFGYLRVVQAPVLAECTLPRGRVVSFSYEPREATRSPLQPVMTTHPVRERPALAAGHNFTVIGYRDTSAAGSVILRVLEKAATQTAAVLTTGFGLSVARAENPVNSFQVLAFGDSFVVILKTTENSELCIFQRRQQTWAPEPSRHKFGKDALVRASGSLLAVAEPAIPGATVLEWVAGNSTWIRSKLDTPRAYRLVMDKHVIVGYGDGKLWLCNQNSQGQWQPYMILTERLVLADKVTLQRFSLAPEVETQLLEVLQQNGLHMSNNLVVWSSLREDRGQLSTRVDLFLLDARHRIIKTQHYDIQRENVVNINRIFEHGNTTFELIYVQENGRFEVKIKNFLAGGIVTSLNENYGNKNPRENARQELLKVYNESEDWKLLFKNSWFVSWNAWYQVHIGAYGVHYGNDTLLRMTGTGWRREPPPVSEAIRLGQHFVLEQADIKGLQFKLYKQDSHQRKQGNSLKDLLLSRPGHLSNRYPAYLAYQENPTTIVVLTFQDQQTLGPAKRFYNEELMLESTFDCLLSLTNASTSSVKHLEPMELLVRPLSNFSLPIKQVAVIRMASAAGNVQRFTGFERTSSTDQASLLYSETIAQIPGANKSLSGWQEETMSVHLYSRNITKSKQAFDAKGYSVPFPPDSQGRDDNSDEAAVEEAGTSASQQMLWDRNGEWLISNFSPFSLEDGMVAYYGFESYESMPTMSPSNTNPKANTWHFKETSIITKKFAFTGENYLHLKRSDNALERILEPRDREEKYIASCWIRCSEPQALNDYVPFMKAIISTDSGEEVIGLLAQIKRVSGEWYYLELFIDFPLIKNIYEKYQSHANQTDGNKKTHPDVERHATKSANFKVTLRISPDSEESLDLDHVRFSPISHDFQATVYQPLTGKSTAVVQANGLVTRTLYNHVGWEIAAVDENGQVEHVVSTSKTGRLVPHPQGAIAAQPPSRLKFEPESGFHETFDAFALRSRWHVQDSEAWLTATGQLWHRLPDRHRVEADAHLFDASSAALRCTFALNAAPAAFEWRWAAASIRLERQAGGFAVLTLVPAERTISPLPLSGELIAMTEHSRLVVWLDGVLLIDEGLPPGWSKDGSVGLWTRFAIEAEGQVLLEDCVVMNRPRLRVEYSDAWGETSQVVDLEGEHTALVAATVRDALGRPAITTKTTRVTRDAARPLLAFSVGFVHGVDPADLRSVWHTGLLRGEVDLLNPVDRGFAYERTVYEPTPFGQKSISGLPGAEFSVTGHYAKHHSQSSGIAFMSNLFPSSQGYRQQVEESPNGSRRVLIFDANDNRVGRYVRVPGYDHIFSTYEYDAKKQLVKILPPLYHEKVRTSMQLDPWQPGDKHLSAEEKKWQLSLGTHLDYDASGNLIRKTTPDSGTVEYLYSPEGQRRFMVNLAAGNQPEQVIYFFYDAQGQLSRTGRLTEPLSTAELKQYLNNTEVPQYEDYQQILYSDSDPDPALRGRLKRFLTYNRGAGPVVETLRFNGQHQVVSKSTLALPGETASSELLANIEKQYRGGLLHALVYPATVDGQPFRLVHQYNRRGQLSGLGTSEHPTFFASFSYHAGGQLASEHHQPNAEDSFTRSYRYNSPGYLDRLSDPFLTEEVSYTEGGYGQDGYGDGMVMRTAFNATWPAGADARAFRLKDDALAGNQFSALCVAALKRSAHLDSVGRPLKLFHSGVDATLPLVCGGRTGDTLARLVAEKQPPGYYGHRYAYGNHREMVKAKYFTDETKPLVAPLQRDSFSTGIPGLGRARSRQVWQLLVDAGYLVADRPHADSSTAIGARGKTFVRDAALREQLAELSTPADDATVYAGRIGQLVAAAINRRRGVTRSEFEHALLHWQGVDEATPALFRQRHETQAQRIYQALTSKGLLPASTSDPLAGLDKSFRHILGNFTTHIPDIVGVLMRHFAHSLGETAFDVSSYDIDANGNHRHFVTGFHSYQLHYRNASNQVHAVEVGRRTASQQQTFLMQHDGQGNVIQALHKGIASIEYDPTSQRTTRVQLTDGRSLLFDYDAQGERVLKRVFDARGELTRETRYLRDEQGQVLVDQRTTYLPAPLPTETVVTSYLYGPRGILGFLRDGVFHSVIADHSGSVRLVVRRGQVVAAYDYLPYGQPMRGYGSDPRSQIAYRFTGQEWDEETGLYNYHARLYDPTIGRFYQPDPQAQYFSPYKYAGNSPVSLVDPDGEFAFLLIGLCVGFALLGAYLGGAAANNRWNPGDWDLKDKGTWFGIIGGGIAGALLPIGFGASVGVIGVGGTLILGAAGTYLTTAAANNDWNPGNWKYDRPATWNAAFQGFGAGTGLVGGVKIAHTFAGRFTSKIFGVANFGKKAILGTSYSTAVGFAYYSGVRANDGKGAFWQWDWTNPGTWAELLNGFDSGMGVPQGFGEIARGLKKLARNSKKLGLITEQIPRSKLQKLKGIVKNPKHPLYKVATSTLMMYYMGAAANNELDITRWGNSFSTYEGVLNGLFFGKDFTNTLKLFRSAKTKKLSNQAIKKQSRSWRKSLDNVLNFARGLQYQRLVEEFLKSENVRSSSPIESAKYFFERGLDAWRNGKSRLPESLHQHLLRLADKSTKDSSKKAIKWLDEANQQKRKEQEVVPDRDADFLGCRAKRRRKRGNAPSRNVCAVVKPSDDFKKDPVDFFAKNSVSTAIIGDIPSTIIKDRVELKTGPIDFKLDRTEFGGYQLRVAQKGDTDVIKGAWLSTKDTIVVQKSGNNPELDAANIMPAIRTDFIFTSELQGCSMYIKYDTDTDQMTVFHHNRADPISIYVNNDARFPLKLEGRQKFVDNSGDDIKALSGVNELLDSNGNRIEPNQDGVIIIDQSLFFENEYKQLVEINRVKSRDVDEIIQSNEKLFKHERTLAEEYDVVIRYEDYLQLPQTYDTLMTHKILPKTFATPFLFRGKNNEWYFVSQKIMYSNSPPAQRKAEAKRNAALFQNLGKEQMYVQKLQFRERVPPLPLANPRNKRVAPPLPSAAARLRPWPLEALASLFSRLSHVRPTPGPNTPIATHDPSTLRCHPGAWRGDRHCHEAFTCTLHPSTTHVFLKSTTTTIRPQTPTPPTTLPTDTYAKASCRPVEFNGRPSVFCEGKTTNMVYTPNLPSRLFDEIDGQILLSVVLPKMAKQLWTFLWGVFAVDEPATMIAVNAGRRRRWQTGVRLLRARVDGLREVVGAQAWDWVQQQVAECGREVEALGRRRLVEASAVDCLEERLAALREEVDEMEGAVGDGGGVKGSAGAGGEAERGVSEVPRGGSVVFARLGSCSLPALLLSGERSSNALETISHRKG